MDSPPTSIPPRQSTPTRASLLLASVAMLLFPFYWLWRGKYVIGDGPTSMTVTRADDPFIFWFSITGDWFFALALAASAVLKANVLGYLRGRRTWR